MVMQSAQCHSFLLDAAVILLLVVVVVVVVVILIVVGEHRVGAYSYPRVGNCHHIGYASK
jgi:hypothetical protein